AGEVKHSEKSQLYAILGSCLVFALFLFLISSAAYYSIGPDFMNALASLAGSSSPQYTLPSPPVLNFLVAFAMPNPFVIVLSGITFMVCAMASVTILVFASVRNFFSWSFDRVMPAAFVKLDSRWNTPYVAVLVAWVLGIILIALDVYTIFFQFLLYLIDNF